MLLLGKGPCHECISSATGWDFTAGLELISAPAAEGKLLPCLLLQLQSPCASLPQLLQEHGQAWERIQPKANPLPREAAAEKAVWDPLDLNNMIPWPCFVTFWNAIVISVRCGCDLHAFRQNGRCFLFSLLPPSHILQNLHVSLGAPKSCSGWAVEVFTLEQHIHELELPQNSKQTRPSTFHSLLTSLLHWLLWGGEFACSRGKQNLCCGSSLTPDKLCQYPDQHWCTNFGK